MNDNNLLNSAGCTEVFHLETAVKEHMLSIGFLRGSSVQTVGCYCSHEYMTSLMWFGNLLSKSPSEKSGLLTLCGSLTTAKDDESVSYVRVASSSWGGMSHMMSMLQLIKRDIYFTKLKNAFLIITQCLTEHY